MCLNTESLEFRNWFQSDRSDAVRFYLKKGLFPYEISELRLVESHPLRFTILA